MSKDFEQFKQAIIDYIEQDNRESIEVNDVTNNSIIMILRSLSDK